MAEELGTLTVAIEGDSSELQQAINQAQSAAESGASAIAQAFESAQNALDPGQFEVFRQVIEADQQAGIDLKQSLEDLSNSASSVGDDVANAASAILDQLTPAENAAADAADHASGSIDHAGESAHEAGEHAHEAAEEFGEMGMELLKMAGITLSIEGLKEIGEEALHASDSITKASIALTNITGSAEEANEKIEGLIRLANNDALSIPNLLTAGQRMQLFLGEGADVVDILSHIADGAAVTGVEIGTAASAFDRIVAGGSVAQKQLMNLGLSMDQLAEAMGVDSDEVKSAFKDMTETDRIETLLAALQNLDGVAKEVADNTFSGAMQRAANDFEEALKGLGDAIKPVVTGLIDLSRVVVIPALKEAIDQWGQLQRAIQGVVAAVKDAITPFQGVADILGKIDFKSLTSELVNAVSHWRDLSDILNFATIGYAKLTNNQQMAVDAEKRIIDAHADLKPKADAAADSTEKVATAHEHLAKAATGAKEAFDPWDEVVLKTQADLVQFAEGLDALNDPINETSDSFLRCADSVEKLNVDMDAFNGMIAQAQPQIESYSFSVGMSSDAIDRFSGATFAAMQYSQMFDGSLIEVTDDLNKLYGGVLTLTPSFDDLGIHATTAGDLMHDAGLKTQAEMQAAADKVKALIEKMDELIAKGQAVNEQDYTELLKKWGDLQQKADDYGKAEDTVKQKGTDMVKQVNDAITRDLAQSMTDLITGAGNVSDAFKRMGQDILDIILNHILKEALSPLLDMLDGIIGKIGGLLGIGGSGGGGIGGALGSIGGDAGSAAGGIGDMLGSIGGGLAGGLIGVGISAISGIVQGFQMARQENTLNAIEESTRYMKIYLGEQPESVLWSVQNIQGNTAGMWEAMGIVEGLIGRAAVAAEYTLGQVADVIVPQLYAMNGYLQDIDNVLGGSGGSGALELSADTTTLFARMAQTLDYILGQITSVEVPLLGRITTATEATFSELAGEIAAGLRNIAADILAGVSGGSGSKSTTTTSSGIPIPSEPASLPQAVQNALMQLSNPLAIVLTNIDQSVLTLQQMLASGALGSTSVNTSINFTGAVVGGQAGIQELTDIILNALADKLRQAGIKI